MCCVCWSWLYDIPPRSLKPSFSCVLCGRFVGLWCVCVGLWVCGFVGLWVFGYVVQYGGVLYPNRGYSCGMVMVMVMVMGIKSSSSYIVF